MEGGRGGCAQKAVGSLSQRAEDGESGGGMKALKWNPTLLTVKTAPLNVSLCHLRDVTRVQHGPRSPYVTSAALRR